MQHDLSMQLAGGYSSILPIQGAVTFVWLHSYHNPHIRFGIFGGKNERLVLRGSPRSLASHLTLSARAWIDSSCAEIHRSQTQQSCPAGEDVDAVPTLRCWCNP